MIERAIAAFGELGFDLNDTEIAGILWLAVQMRRSDSSSVSKSQQQTQASTSKIAVTSTQLPLNQNKNSQDSSIKTESSANVYPLSSQDSDQTSSGLSIKVPAAQALRNQLAIARSLKPLKRRVPSKSEFILDETATAERIAEEKLLLPVMRPAPERWLELALVIDEGASMMLWKQTIKEFKQLLEKHGAFRDVRTWELFTDERGKVWLRPRTGSISRQKRLHNPRELIDPNGKRLFVIISDCVSPAWRNGAITKTLAAWACSSPTAIIQVLPEWLWERSALGVAESILLKGLAPGVPNQKLIMTALDLLDESDVVNKLKVPVVTLEPESLKNWARMVAGAGDVQTKGFLLAPDSEIFDVSSESTENSSVELSAKQRLQRFRLTASPMARKLAGLLAAVPISLPVVRLVQQTMLPQSSQVHVAEVFLGGILKPLSPVYEGVEADKIQYDFVDGVRDLLLDAVPLTESTQVLRKVSEYVAQRFELSVDDFTAILVNPGLVDSSSGVLVRPFAQITAKVLRRFGRKYAKLVEGLEQSFPSLSEEKALKITMLGPTGVGKTTILTVMRKAMDLAVSNSTLRLNPGKPDDDGFARSIALGAFQEYERKLSQLIDTKNFTVQGGLDGNNQNTEFYFYLSNLRGDRNSSKLLLEFQDYPGGWILPNDSQRSTVVEYLKNSPITIIAIDTPALIEKDGQYHEPINMGNYITDLLREVYEADNHQSPQKRLVIFAPVKCEKYMQESQADRINIAIKKRYKTLLGDLRQRQSHVAAVIIPIQTVGGVVFSYIDKRQQNPGEIPPFWYQQTRNPRWESVNAEQPLRFILAFLLRNYLQERQEKRGIDRDLKEYIKYFVQSSVNLAGPNGIELIQGDDLLDFGLKG
jgi:hypothetical protein